MQIAENRKDMNIRIITGITFVVMVGVNALRTSCLSMGSAREKFRIPIPTSSLLQESPSPSGV
jgi:hypothetical protein